MHTEGCFPSSQIPVAEYPPLSPVQKQVWFNLGNDLGEAPSLLMDLANFLGGNAANEQNDALHPLLPILQNPHSCYVTMATSDVPPTP